MRLAKLAIALVTLALALPACESAPEGPVAPAAPAFADHNQDGVVDGNDLVIWWGPSRTGSGNLKIYAGARTPASTSDDDGDDGLIFEFADGSIIGRTTPSSGTPDDDDVVFGPIAHMVGPQIFDPHGNLLCEADYGDQPGTYHLRDADGVLFTLWERLVFKGAAAIRPTDWLDRAKGYGFLMPEHGHDLRYSYNNFQIHRGWWPDGEVLATATAIIHLASPIRLLVIAALIDGKCGSLGIG